MTTPEDVLGFWFGPIDAPDYPADNSPMWWKKNPAVDAACGSFAEALKASAEGAFEAWSETARGRLAHILLVDQISRNLHRGSGEMYAQDDLALALSLRSVAEGDPWGRPYRELQFYLMPLMHAEDRGVQRFAVEMFRRAYREASPADAKWSAKGVEYAILHRDIVERFGRFPHRNALLGRESTPEEVAFLKEPGSSF